MVTLWTKNVHTAKRPEESTPRPKATEDQNEADHFEDVGRKLFKVPKAEIAEKVRSSRASPSIRRRSIASNSWGANGVTVMTSMNRCDHFQF